MKRTKDEALATKRHIMTTATALFLERGFTNTKLDHIAKETHLTRGAIYWHFKDKADLVREIISSEINGLYQILDEAFSASMPADSKMYHVIETVVKNFYENKSFQNFIELTWFKIEYVQLSELFHAKAEPTAYFMLEFEKIVHEAQSQELIRNDIEAINVSITVTNLINGMYRMFFLLPDMMATKEDAMLTFDNYLKLISMDSSKPI